MIGKLLPLGWKQVAMTILMRLIEYVSIESEEHVILHCPLYDELRKVMFDHAENVNPDFINMTSEE